MLSCDKSKRSLRSLERAAHCSGLLSDLSLPSVQLWRTERRRYFKLLNEKRSAFWTGRIDAERSQPCRLWRSFDQLLGRGSALEAEIDASVLHRFFDDNVGVAAGVSAPAVQLGEDGSTIAPVECELRLYTPLTADDVIKMVHVLPGKQCLSDPLYRRGC